MARFFEKGEEPNQQYYYEAQGIVVPLNNDTLIANLHEVMTVDMAIEATDDAIYDRVLVEDPRDKEWFVHWRAEMGDESFAKVEYVARRCGTLLIRQTALETVKREFDLRFASDLRDMDTIPDDWLEVPDES